MARNQSTFYLDDEERKSRGSRRLKYGSSDKDHHEDEKDAAAAFDRDDDDDDSDDDGCDDNYDDESEEEEEGSERQPKDADVSNEKGKSSSAASTKPKSKSFKERLFGKRKKLKVDPKHQQLLGKIADLESEKVAAESKIRQLQLQMSNEAEEVSKAQEERDEFKAEVSKLQLEVEGLKAQLDKAESDLDDFKDLRNSSSVLGMISLHGFLWKRGMSGLTGRNWRHRYFRQENDGKIHYYWRAGRIWWSKGFIDISKITDVEDVHDSETEQFCFNVMTPNRTYEIRAKDNDHKLKWMKGIRGLVYWTNHKEETVNQIFNP